MDIDHLVFDVGDRVTGWGELRQHGGEVWFDPPHGVARMKTDGPSAMSDEAARLEGAELSATTSRPRGDGSTALWATVTGCGWETRSGSRSSPRCGRRRGSGRSTRGQAARPAAGECA